MLPFMSSINAETPEKSCAIPNCVMAMKFPYLCGHGDNCNGVINHDILISSNQTYVKTLKEK